MYFNSGDDDIAIKSGRNEDGRRVGVPSENIVIQNCTMADGHGGITLGSCISGGIRNVFAEDCYLDSPNLDTAIRVKNNALRGGLLEKFYLRNIRVGQVAKQVRNVDRFPIHFRNDMVHFRSSKSISITKKVQMPHSNQS